MTHYRIAAVSYLNTLPFLHGLRSSAIAESAGIVMAHPARCAAMLAEGEADIALCPVGALGDLGEWHLLTDYCIGSDGPVRTVCVYSHVPFEEIREIRLSPESRTSNLLVRVLDRACWHRNLRFLRPDQPAGDPERCGELFIGDICFEKEGHYPFHLDLGKAWKDHTGLPFAFACWVSRAPVPREFENRLNVALAHGVEAIPVLTESHDLKDRLSYLTENMSYAFDDRKREALGRFLEMAASLSADEVPSGR